MAAQVLKGITFKISAGELRKGSMKKSKCRWGWERKWEILLSFQIWGSDLELVASFLATSLNFADDGHEEHEEYVYCHLVL